MNYFGYHCVFTPEEILHAAGFTPLRLFPVRVNEGYKEGCFHVKSCEFARKLFENFQEGAFDFLKGALFTQCCDSLKAVYDLLPRQGEWIFYVNTPISMGSKLANKGTLPDLQFFADEFRRLVDKISKVYDIHIASKEIKSSILIYQKSRDLLSQLESIYRKGKISTSDYFVVVKAGYCVRKEKYNQLLIELIAILTEQNQNSSQKEGAPVLLVGGINANYNGWVEYLASMGARVVGEDLCGFSRSNLLQQQNYVDPFLQLSVESHEKFCPIKLSYQSRLDNIVNLYNETGARGIIFMIFQYCDVQQLDYAEIKQQLIQRKIPVLLINPTLSSQRTAQIETRLEAFLEMIHV